MGTGGFGKGNGNGGSSLSRCRFGVGISRGSFVNPKRAASFLEDMEKTLSVFVGVKSGLDCLREVVEEAPFEEGYGAEAIAGEERTIQLESGDEDFASSGRASFAGSEASEGTTIQLERSELSS